MKSITLLFSLIFMATSAFAANTSGDLSVGGSFVDGNGADKSAKFLEYRDIDNQLTTDLNLRLVNGALYLGAEGKNLGYDDQELSLKGGMFGKGKFSLWYDELTHNYSLDDRTIYAGVGTTTLTLAPGVTPTDVTTWQTLDYAVDRQQVGAKLELTFDTPFFVTFNVNQTEKDGEFPIAIERGRAVQELPMPIDYKTTNLSVKAGYRTKVMFAQVDASLSKFENANSLISAGWYSPSYNPAAMPITSSLRTPTETFTLAPDNDMWQIGGQFVLRDLPLNSVLAVRGSYAVMESDPVLTTADSFDGELTYSKAAVTLKSRPTAKLDTEIAYSFLQKDNKAARFNYDGSDTHIFEYSKHHAGLSAAYRINSANRVKAGYDYLIIDRAEEMRHDAEKTDEQTVFVEWKNTAFERFTPKVRYEHMVRTSEFNGASLAGTSGFYAFVRPFDAADKTQDKLRIIADMSPTDNVDLGLEFNMSRGDYDETVLGRTGENAQAALFDANFKLPYKAKLHTYVDYERREVDSHHVRWNSSSAATVGGLLDILNNTTANGTYYQWFLNRQDITKSVGVDLELPVLNDRLLLSAGFDYLNNDGKADFSSSSPVLADIMSYDDYVKQTLKLKAEFAIRENLKLVTGYTYEKCEFEDVLTDDYVAQFGTTYLSGAYADMNYEANIGYVTLNYKF